MPNQRGNIMAKLEKVIIEINGQRIGLSIDEAKSLKQELEKLFPEPAVPYPVIYRWPYVPTVPWITYTSVGISRDDATVTFTLK